MKQQEETRSTNSTRCLFMFAFPFNLEVSLLSIWNSL